MDCTNGMSTRLSWVLAAETATASGSPFRSVSTCSLEPGLPRSTGFGPVSEPPYLWRGPRVNRFVVLGLVRWRGWMSARSRGQGGAPGGRTTLTAARTGSSWSPRRRTRGTSGQRRLLTRRDGRSKLRDQAVVRGRPALSRCTELLLWRHDGRWGVPAGCG